MSGGTLDATLGNVSSDGVDVELAGGLNFKSGLKATFNPSTEVIDIEMVDPDGPTATPAAALISRTRYVDKGTTVAEVDQTGTLAAPFSTLNAAVANLLALEATEVSPPYHYTILCFPGNYSAEADIGWETSAYGIGLTIAAAVPGDYRAGNVELPGLIGRTSNGGPLNIVGCYANDGISGAWTSVKAIGCKLAGALALGTNVLEAIDCWINQPSLTCGALHMRGGLLDITTLLCGGTSVTVFGAFGTFIGYMTFTGSAGVLTVDGVTDPGLSGTTLTNGTKTVL